MIADTAYFNWYSPHLQHLAYDVHERSYKTYYRVDLLCKQLNKAIKRCSAQRHMLIAPTLSRRTQRKNQQKIIERSIFCTI